MNRKMRDGNKDYLINPSCCTITISIAMYNYVN